MGVVKASTAAVAGLSINANDGDNQRGKENVILKKIELVEMFEELHIRSSSFDKSDCESRQSASASRGSWAGKVREELPSTSGLMDPD